MGFLPQGDNLGKMGQINMSVDPEETFKDSLNRTCKILWEGLLRGLGEDRFIIK